MSGYSHKHKGFLRAVAIVSTEHEDAASEFFIVKKDELQRALPTVAKSEASVCILWGFDPATNQEVCLQWSNLP
jgi:hypothetical protein